MCSGQSQRPLAVDSAPMAEQVVLGEVTCPTGERVLMDGGYLGLWSGDRPPDKTRGWSGS